MCSQGKKRQGYHFVGNSRWEFQCKRCYTKEISAMDNYKLFKYIFFELIAIDTVSEEKRNILKQSVKEHWARLATEINNVPKAFYQAQENFSAPAAPSISVENDKLEIDLRNVNIILFPDEPTQYTNINSMYFRILIYQILINERKKGNVVSQKKGVNRKKSWENYHNRLPKDLQAIITANDLKKYESSKKQKGGSLYERPELPASISKQIEEMGGISPLQAFLREILSQDLEIKNKIKDYILPDSHYLIEKMIDDLQKAFLWYHQWKKLDENGELTIDMKILKEMIEKTNEKMKRQKMLSKWTNHPFGFLQERLLLNEFGEIINVMDREIARRVVLNDVNFYFIFLISLFY
jgi:hypothetical protein